MIEAAVTINAAMVWITGAPMTPNAVGILAFVVMILPMGHFLLAAPGFFFAKLDIPAVGQLLRALFGFYFRALAIAAILGTLIFAVAGRWAFVVGVVLLIYAVAARRWFLPRLDAQIAIRPADVGSRLRRLHCGGMLCNAIQLAVVIACIPYVMDAPN